MNDYEFWNGNRIYVNLNWRQDGYAIAYQNGVYGYVDALCVRLDVSEAQKFLW